MELQLVINSQREFFQSNQTKDIQFRKNQLVKLKKTLKQNEDFLLQAIYKDFKKSEFEAYMTELAFTYHEIDLALKNISQWSSRKKVSSEFHSFPSRSYIQPEPLGVALIIGAWNYPYQLVLVPLISAIAAGNTCILKPSELSSYSASALAKLINQNFDSSFLYVVCGGVEVSQELLSYEFDKIFFTGSTAVGKIVAMAAAKNLTPVTLELGGKSPCIVCSDADLKVAAQRIVWGKYLNAGQTCIAPDYLLVEDSIYLNFLNELKKHIIKNIGENPMLSENYTRIINLQHTQRLQKLIDPSKIYFGGQVIESENYIEPTVLKDIVFSDDIMKEEIFGPLLPVIRFHRLDEAINEIKKRPRPLALYCFTGSQAKQSKIMNEISFGGGGVNEVIMHIANSKLPFGGVGASGMGSYHGEFGFKAFSHSKSLIIKPTWLEFSFRYRPYTQFKKFILKLFLR